MVSGGGIQAKVDAPGNGALLFRMGIKSLRDVGGLQKVLVAGFGIQVS
jgi:hypothetical protein